MIEIGPNLMKVIENMEVVPVAQAEGGEMTTQTEIETMEEADQPAVEPPSDLERELSHLLNRHSAENASNTPDYILAQYLLACLAAWNTATQQRENWYGRDPRPSSDGWRCPV